MLASQRGFHLPSPIDPVVRVEHVEQLRLDRVVGELARRPGATSPNGPPTGRPATYGRSARPRDDDEQPRTLLPPLAVERRPEKSRCIRQDRVRSGELTVLLLQRLHLRT